MDGVPEFPRFSTTRFPAVAFPCDACVSFRPSRVRSRVMSRYVCVLAVLLHARHEEKRRATAIVKFNTRISAKQNYTSTSHTLLSASQEQRQRPCGVVCSALCRVRIQRNIRAPSPSRSRFCVSRLSRVCTTTPHTRALLQNVEKKKNRKHTLNTHTHFCSVSLLRARPREIREKNAYSLRARRVCLFGGAVRDACMLTFLQLLAVSRGG